VPSFTAASRAAVDHAWLEGSLVADAELHARCRDGLGDRSSHARWCTAVLATLLPQPRGHDLAA